jgi:hypothetical protein
MDEPVDSGKGLSIGKKRLSELPPLVLLRRALGYGAVCLGILYGGAVAIGHTPGFAYLAATRVGDAFGDSLTGAESSVSASLRHLEIRNLRTITNRNQKVIYTRIERVNLAWDYRAITSVEITGMSADVVAQTGGDWTPSGLGVLADLPLVNRIAPAGPLRRKLGSTPPPSADFVGDVEIPVDPEEEDIRRHSFTLADLPPLRVVNGSFRLKARGGDLLLDVTGLNLAWTPAARDPEGRDRLVLQAQYLIPARKLPRLGIDVAVSMKDGHYSFDKLEAETPLMLEAGRFLEKLATPPSAKPSARPPATPPDTPPGKGGEAQPYIPPGSSASGAAPA